MRDLPTLSDDAGEGDNCQFGLGSGDGATFILGTGSSDILSKGAGYGNIAGGNGGNFNWIFATEFLAELLSA